MSNTIYVVTIDYFEKRNYVFKNNHDKIETILIVKKRIDFAMNDFVREKKFKCEFLSFDMKLSKINEKMKRKIK